MRGNYSYKPRTPGLTVALAVLTTATVCLAGCGVAVRTYHYDNLRTGWNPLEKKLNYGNVNTASMRVLTLQLDDVNDQVDTQPLIVPRMKIAGKKHDVVYVATENNNVYAIDADTDTKLLKVNLGTAISPWGCGNNGPTVGINGTPAIDLISRTLYAIAYTFEQDGTTPAYFIHALDLATLTDKVPPVKVMASNGPYTFHAHWQRQRPGLLLANGNVYAGFGSFCDWGGDQSRGWVLGWKAGSLTPLATNELNNSQATEPNGMFLSSVWMSGYGLAADPIGNVYFTTGNSDYSGTQYDQCTNISESVVRLNGDLTRAWPCPNNNTTNNFLFTPANVSTLEVDDTDVGSAGVMALPAQLGSVTNMAVATAKDGRLFLLNRDNMGGLQPNDAGALGTENMGADGIGTGWSGNGCWCGPSYFNDGTPRVVSSGGDFVPGVQQNSLRLWTLQTSPQPKLVQTASANMPDTVQDPGFFTTVSSKGASNAIIWAVSRPQANGQFPGIWLYAFKGTPSGNTLPPLFQARAGNWQSPAGGNANIVPVVADGKVYVASYRELDIFGHGLKGGQRVDSRKEVPAAEVKAESPKGPQEHQISGKVSKVDGTHLTIEARDHKMVQVDAGKARESFRYPPMVVGMTVVAAGSYDANGVLLAELVWRAKQSPAAWSPDR